MAAPRSGTCGPWATLADLCSPCDDYSTNAAQMEEALQAASDILYALSGRQFPGVCTNTVHIEARCLGDYTPHDPAVHGRIDRRTRRNPREITLGAYPIQTITSVTLDGAVVDAALYEVRDWRWLARLDDPDGTNPAWAFEDTLVVEFTHGRMPPPSGVAAAAELACQLYLACQPETTDASSGCRLPKRVTSIVRQGVAIALLDPMDFLEQGLTGLYAVDLFIKSVNPHGLRQRAVVASPDIPRRGYRVTG